MRYGIRTEDFSKLNLPGKDLTYTDHLIKTGETMNGDGQQLDFKIGCCRMGISDPITG